MKKYMILALLLPFFGSCSWEEDLDKGDGDGNVTPMTRAAFIGYAISMDDFDDREEDGFEATDDIKTVRFIIFTDLYTYPKKEVNRLEKYLISSVVSTERLSALRGFFKVSPADKLVVAIVNEPTELSGKLGNVKTLRDLEEIYADLERDNILSPDHRSLLPGVMMPMSGFVLTKKEDMKQTEDEIFAVAAKNLPKIKMSRMLARVDVYMTTDIAGGVTIQDDSSVTLGNTFTLSPFVRHENGNKELGLMQTVPPGGFTTREWRVAAGSAATTLTPEDTEAKYICSFYTPERMCLTDKLTVDIALNTSDGEKSASIVLDKMYDEDKNLLPINSVKRNNRYIVKGKITESREIRYGLGVDVMKWNEGLEAFPLGQYYLNVDRSRLAFPVAGGRQTVTVGANHPAGWKIEEADNLPAGVTAQRIGTTDVIEITAAANTSAQETAGWFALRSGNLKKIVHVTREKNTPPFLRITTQPERAYRTYVAYDENGEPYTAYVYDQINSPNNPITNGPPYEHTMTVEATLFNSNAPIVYTWYLSPMPPSGSVPPEGGSPESGFPVSALPVSVGSTITDGGRSLKITWEWFKTIQIGKVYFFCVASSPESGAESVVSNAVMLKLTNDAN